MERPARRLAFARIAAALVLKASMLAGATGAQATGPAATEGWASRVTAVYKLRMAGMDLATFNFSSTATRETYDLAGHGKLSWGFGLYSYNGNFSSAGRLVGEEVRPTIYAYDWRANRKSGSVRIGFGGAEVKSVELVPPHTPSADAVPVRQEHLRNVFDPLSALIALARYRDGEPCDRKIAVFEGKQRIDLVLSAHRLEKVVEAKPTGQPIMAHVCRVRYIPVGGHRLNRENQALVKAEGIEVALRPVPAANLLVPFRVTIPTPLGTAVLTAQRVEITAPDHKLIALAH